MQTGKPDFVLVDVRSPEAYAKGHTPGAVNIPHRTMTAERMAEYDQETVFVVYCAGPHCNGANKAAVRLARLGRPVKEMIGGITGWLDEGLSLHSKHDDKAELVSRRGRARTDVAKTRARLAPRRNAPSADCASDAY